MNDPRKIDFSAKKTEAEWQATLDAFVLAATPKLFEWLRWVLTLAVLRFVAQKTGSTALSVSLAITNGLLVLYFYSYFFQFSFTHAGIRSVRVARVVSVALSGALGGITWYLVVEAVHAVVAAQP